MIKIKRALAVVKLKLSKQALSISERYIFSSIVKCRIFATQKPIRL